MVWVLAQILLLDLICINICLSLSLFLYLSLDLLLFMLNVVSLGIFSRPKVYIPSPERWSLQIQQTTLNFSFFGVGRFFSTNYTYHPPSADPMPVCAIINDISQKGGRLLCMECTGTVFSTGMSFSRAGGKLSS